MPACSRLPYLPFIAAAGRARWALALVVGIALSSACTASPAGGIYLIGDVAESIHLSDQADSPAARLLIDGDGPLPARLLARTASVRGSTQEPGWRFADIVERAARDNRVEPEFLRAMIDVESGSSARAVSPRGARGLMQLMPATAVEYGVNDPFDPRQNIRAGARHLRRLLDRYGQDKTLALAAYNAGPAAVARHHGRIPPYAETMAYVPRVLQRYAALQQESNPPLRAFP